MGCAKSVVLLGVLLLVGHLALPVHCFIPTSLYSYFGSLFEEESSLPDATTHVAMTRMAILRVAAKLLRDNPYNEESRLRIDALRSDFNEDDLVFAYYGEKRRRVTKLFEDAIEDIGDGNAGVDDSEAHIPLAHFDAERFQQGQNRLTDIRRTVVGQIQREEYEDARSETGRMLHTLQDFYSHSNWVEMGNTEPYSGLGQYGERPVVASPSTPTCTDCRRDGTVGTSYIPFVTSADYYYECENNIRGDILSGRLLTSGYYSNQAEQVFDTEEGETVEVEIDKPFGKCSHGGYLDATSDDHATGGINKDSPYPRLSPHSNLHLEAARIAEQATVNIMNDIRMEVGDDEKFGAYLDLFIKTATSVAYVIDTTGSMGEELPQIQATIPQLRISLQQYRDSIGESAEIKYILVPFNDPGLFPARLKVPCQFQNPGLIYETDDIEQFLSGIASLGANGGGDAPEPSIGALIRAIKASEEGSPIFVFTDASASDTYRIREAQALIAQKSVRVTYAFVGSFRKRSVDNNMQVVEVEERKRQVDEAYEFLATLSGGQVLNLGTDDLASLGELVRFTADQAQITILRETGVVTETLYIDESIEQAIISVTGDGYPTSFTSPSGVQATSLDQYSVSLQTLSTFIATLNINSSDLLGEWQISFSYASDIVVYAISDLSFSTKLFALDPTSSYGFSAVDGKPLNGQPLIAAFQANDRVKGIKVETINVVDSSGTVLQTVEDILVLGANAFAVRFTPPSVVFHWQILGKDEQGRTFSRISDTAIEVSDIDLKLGEGETGFYTLRPGNNVTIPVELYNAGSEAYFSLSIDQITSGNDSLDISAYLNNMQIIVGANATQEFTVEIAVPESATDGLTSTFTLIAESTLDESNDFVVFKVAVTTRPPPEFTENEYGVPSSATGWSGYTVVLLCSIFMVLRELY